MRDAATAEAASRIAVHPPVRAALVDVQRRFAGQAPGAVLDGRDIGTVICPDADHKLFVTADIEVRAARRHKELIARGEASIYARVLEDLRRRDHRDLVPCAAPTRQADDAVELDTTHLDIEGAVAAALAAIAPRTREPRPRRPPAWVVFINLVVGQGPTLVREGTYGPQDGKAYHPPPPPQSPPSSP